jgi:hypothetical protein
MAMPNVWLNFSKAMPIVVPPVRKASTKAPMNKRFLNLEMGFSMLILLLAGPKVFFALGVKGDTF